MPRGDVPAAPDEARDPADLELVRRVLSGDDDAIAQFTDRMRCVPRMLAQLDRRFGAGFSGPDQQDLEQDTLAAIWRRLPDYDGTARLESWAFGFCGFVLRNALRSRKRRQQLRTDGDIDGVVDEADPLQALSARLSVTAAMVDLPGDVAGLLRLKHFDGLTFAEIGDRLGISPNTAKTKYYRALETLADRLDNDEEST